MVACKLHLLFFIPLSQCHRSSTVEGAPLWTTNCFSSNYLAHPWKSSRGCQPTLPAGPCNSPACLRHVRQNRIAPHSATSALSRVSPWPVASFSFQLWWGWHSGVHTPSIRSTLRCLDSSTTRLGSICVIFTNACELAPHSYSGILECNNSYWNAKSMVGYCGVMVGSQYGSCKFKCMWRRCGCVINTCLVRGECVINVRLMHD